MKKLYLVLLFITFCNASVMQQGEFYKQKQEIVELKRELNNFYNKKEEQYQKQKKELEVILSTIQKEKKQIEDIKKENQKILDEINKTVTEEAIVLYDKMKVKVALDIFNKMIADGKINEVFDIMIRLKQKRVLTLLKKFDVETKTILMEKMKNYDIKKQNKGDGK